MLLVELHGYKKYQEMLAHEVTDYLQKHDIEVHNGGYGVVLAPKNKDYVYRFWTADSGYEAFLKFMATHGATKYFPKILGSKRSLPMVFKRDKNISQHYLNVIKIEKLKPLEAQEDDLMSRVSRLLEFNKMDLETLKAQVKTRYGEDLYNLMRKHDPFFHLVFELRAFFKSHPKAGFDFHSNNVMKRDNGDWVIIDPAYSTLEHVDQLPDIMVRDDPKYKRYEEPDKEPEKIKGRTSPLKEAFSSKVDYKITTEVANRLEATVMINDRKVNYEAYLKETKPSGEVWELEFHEVDKKDGRRRFRNTGSGGELKVFAGVKQFTQELIDRHSPFRIEFTASNEWDERRANLYHRMFEKFNFKNYTLHRKKHQAYDMFILERK